MSNKLVESAAAYLGGEKLNESAAEDRIEKVQIALEKLRRSDFAAAIGNAKNIDMKRSKDWDNDKIGVGYALEAIEEELDEFKAQVAKAYKTLGL